MYKTKLQELCHQKTWNLPEYSTAKEGLDHHPLFRATVTVNGHSFSSLTPAKSSKLAQNEAAKVAFDHFSSSSSSSAVVSPSSGCTSTVANSDLINNEKTSQESNQIPSLQEKNQIPSTPIAKNDDRLADVEHLYKNLLQSYAQKRSIILPVYSCEHEGPPHARRFKCKVTIDGITYESHEFFSTSSKAEHAAAKVALMSLAPDGVEEDESAYKNLLQELAQKEGYLLPAYSTITSGQSHKPTFISTVEVNEESFTGQETRTKKQAEFNAAKVAYKALKQRISRQSPLASTYSSTSHHPTGSCSGNSYPSLMASSSSNLRQRPITHIGKSSESAQRLSPPHQRQKVVQSTTSSRSDLTAYLQLNVQPRMPVDDKQAEDDKVVVDGSTAPPFTSADAVSCNSHISTILDPHIASPWPESGFVKDISPSPCPFIPSLPEHGVSSSSTLADTSTNSPAITSMEHPTGANMLCHNKVIVHPRGTNMTYPSGSTVLPMSDDNWVAVRTPQSSQ